MRGDTGFATPGMAEPSTLHASATARHESAPTQNQYLTPNEKLRGAPGA